MEDLVRHKKEMDNAIIMIGVASRVEDLNAAYCTALLNYEWMRRYEKDGDVEFTMSDSVFMRDLNHIANYNLVRVASECYIKAVDGELEPEKCRCQLSQCLMTLKDHEEMYIERDLIEEIYNNVV